MSIAGVLGIWREGVTTSAGRGEAAGRWSARARESETGDGRTDLKMEPSRLLSPSLRIKRNRHMARRRDCISDSKSGPEWAGPNSARPSGVRRGGVETGRAARRSASSRAQRTGTRGYLAKSSTPCAALWLVI